MGQQRLNGVQLQHSYIFQIHRMRPFTFDEVFHRGAQLSAAHIVDILDERFDAIGRGNVFRCGIENQFSFHHIVGAGHFGKGTANESYRV